MGRARRSYTDEDKAAALALYAEQGPTEVERQMGIPKATVASWAKRTGTRTVCIEKARARVEAAHLAWEERRLDMADRIGTAAELALVQCENALAGIAGSPSMRDAKDAATTMAILIDKAQLLTGAATSRQEQHVHQATRDAVIEEARARALHLVPRGA